MSFVRPEIDAMAGYVPGEQPQAGKFIKLNTNENPYPPSAAVNRAIKERLDQGLERYPDPMATSFRMRAAEVLGVEPDWILCGNGSDDILTIVTRAFVGTGQWLRLPTPSYVLYKTLAEIQGADSEEIAFNDDWSLPEAFSTGSNQLRLAFLPNPNSPSGTVVPKDQIAAAADALPCPLLVDEAYVDFANENCIDLVKQNDKVLVSRTLSKSYALAGLRFGYVVAQPHVIAQLMKVKDSYNCDALSIAGATAAIDDQEWLRTNRAKVIKTRQRMTDKMREIGFTVPDSQANFVWGTYPGKNLKALYEFLKQNRVLVRYMHYPNYEPGIRISVGGEDQIDACLMLIETALAQGIA
ncbi:histidinol-phosphate transaminase [Blastopirellula sp. JC732]|uniref:Histidinol-phosphate aminotransferase n=1 Tax=Blastopirellula sediminis TaxID=2894196 RepID=A0A9X1SMN3_9BACT|nr:histidinol-phosphate transaminase [Blastopirellula sediminis]MCC9604827.1 histidinol-phosphate transaminase [Blastopirellula sediminis]MCC9631874.1 histidinol-phosphate transaminase [Blastopirellula sediminis]